MKTPSIQKTLAVALLAIGSSGAWASAGNSCSGAGCEAVVSSGMHNDNLNPMNQKTDIEVNIGQFNDSYSQATTFLENVIYKSVESTSTTVGNNVNVGSVNGSFVHAHVAQRNEGVQISESAIVGIRTDIKTLELTNVAIGNNSSFNLEGSSRLNASLEQCNTGVQKAITSIRKIDPVSMSAMNTAIGNTISVNVR